MANEITIQAYIKVQNGNLRDEFNVGSKSINQTGVGGPTPGYVTIGTTEETVSFGELSTRGYCIIQNLDATNYIEFGGSTGVYMCRLKAGEFALLRLNNTNLFMQANTAACKVLIKAYED